MRHELTDNQRTYVAEYIGQQQSQQQQPLHIHNHIYGGTGGGNGKAGFSVMAFIGAVSVGFIVYSMYSGKTVTETYDNMISKTEAKISEATKPSWWPDKPSWWPQNPFKDDGNGK